MFRSKALLLRDKVSLPVIDIIESWLRLVSIKESAKRNQVAMMAELRDCVGNAACYWNPLDSSMFAYACLSIHHKYGWG
jgi:hypothetical protein